mgnify:CR=1 FL=1
MEQKPLFLMNKSIVTKYGNVLIVDMVIKFLVRNIGCMTVILEGGIINDRV